MTDPQLDRLGDPAIAFVVDRFNAMLEADGARLELVSAAADALMLRYVSADGTEAGECEACVLDPDDLEQLVGEALQRQSGAARAVTVLR